jgi:hypothetical protein
VIERFGYSWRDESGRVAVIIAAVLAAIAGEMAWRARAKARARALPARLFGRDARFDPCEEHLIFTVEAYQTVYAHLSAATPPLREHAIYAIADIMQTPAPRRTGLARLGGFVPSTPQLATAVAVTFAVMCSPAGRGAAEAVKLVDLRGAAVGTPVMTTIRRLAGPRRS